jgi:hypothetical protein
MVTQSARSSEGVLGRAWGLLVVSVQTRGIGSVNVFAGNSGLALCYIVRVGNFLTTNEIAQGAIFGVWLWLIAFAECAEVSADRRWGDGRRRTEW